MGRHIVRISCYRLPRSLSRKLDHFNSYKKYVGEKRLDRNYPKSNICVCKGDQTIQKPEAEAAVFTSLPREDRVFTARVPDPGVR